MLLGMAGVDTSRLVGELLGLRLACGSYRLDLVLCKTPLSGDISNLSS